MTHVWIEAYHTFEWVMSHMWMSHCLVGIRCWHQMLVVAIRCWQGTKCVAVVLCSKYCASAVWCNTLWCNTPGGNQILAEWRRIWQGGGNHRVFLNGQRDLWASSWVSSWVSSYSFKSRSSLLHSPWKFHRVWLFLKSQLAAMFTMWNHYRAHFWLFVSLSLSLSLSPFLSPLLWRKVVATHELTNLLFVFVSSHESWICDMTHWQVTWRIDVWHDSWISDMTHATHELTKLLVLELVFLKSKLTTQFTA